MIMMIILHLVNSFDTTYYGLQIKDIIKTCRNEGKINYNTIKKPKQ